MKQLFPFLAAAVAALSAGCAAAPIAKPAATTHASADASCRRLATNGRTGSHVRSKDTILCGTPAQWRAFDEQVGRRAAILPPALGFEYSVETPSNGMMPSQANGAPWPPSQCCLP
jgi:hypothetical protein